MEAAPSLCSTRVKFNKLLSAHEQSQVCSCTAATRLPPTDGRPRASSVWLACEGENVNIAMKTHPFPCVKNVRCAHFFHSLLVAKKLCGVPARKAIVLLQNVMDPFSFCT